MTTTQVSLAALIDTDASIHDFLSPTEISECCVDAASETGWAYPVVDPVKELWIKQRAKRHCYFKLWTQAARKFKVDQLNLNQRFDHYKLLIKQMDEAFATFVEENPEMLSDVETYKLFGTISGTGLVYDIAGKDVTGLVEQ